MPRVILIVLFCLAAHPSLAQDPIRFLEWTQEDAVSIARSGLRAGPMVAASAAGFFAGSALLDPGTNERFQHISSARVNAFLDQANHLGGPEATWPVIGVFGISLLTDSPRFQDAAFTSLESLILAGAVSYSLKYAFGRARPLDAEDPSAFSPLSGNSSFPSGHTTTAFAIVTPWVYYYPGPATYGLFAVAGGTAIARLHKNKHWATDVLAGAALGFGVARKLARSHGARLGSRRSRSRLQVSPGHVSYVVRLN